MAFPFPSELPDSVESIRLTSEQSHVFYQPPTYIDRARPPKIVFTDTDGQEVGSLFVNAEGQLDFVGSPSESAAVFVNYLKHLWNDAHPETPR